MQNLYDYSITINNIPYTLSSIKLTSFEEINNIIKTTLIFMNKILIKSINIRKNFLISLPEYQILFENSKTKLNLENLLKTNLYLSEIKLYFIIDEDNYKKLKKFKWNNGNNHPILENYNTENDFGKFLKSIVIHFKLDNENNIIPIL